MPQYFTELDDEPMIRLQTDFRGGANEFLNPVDLPDSGLQRLQDMLVEDNGRARLRPGADALSGAAITAARIEALSYFDTPALEYVYASIAASLRQWNGSAWTNLGGYPFGGSSIIEMAQGNNLLYLSTGSGAWYYHDGTNFSGSQGSAATDPPNGASIMCWHTNRMFAAGTISGLYDQIFASNLGNAGTGQWNSTTFAFRVGRGEGEAITALGVAKGFWLAVGKEGSLYMVYCNPQATSAADWPILRVAGSVGVVGKRCMAFFGDFIVVLGRDGVRKIQATDTEDTPWEITPPISEPMQPYIDRINWSAASKSILHKYRHYLFVAVPLDSATDPSHVLVWNSRLQSWMGVWTGWTPTAVCTSRFSGVERLLVGDTTGKVNQWKDYASQSLASTFQENNVDLGCKLRSRRWNFEAPANWKDPNFAEVVFEDSGGNVDLVCYLDGTERRRETKTLFRIQNQLPLSLPFDLAVDNPEPVVMSLDGLPEARELDIGIESTARKVQVKTITVGAFLNTLKTA